MLSIRIWWKIGSKIVPDDKIAGELSSRTAAVATSLVAMNMPHTPGTAFPLSNIGDISERSTECTEAERERCIAAEAMARPVGKLMRRRDWRSGSLWG